MEHTVKSSFSRRTSNRALDLLEQDGMRNTDLQRMIDIPFVRREVIEASHGTGYGKPMTKDDWVETQVAINERKIELGLPKPDRPLADLVAAAYQAGYGSSRHFQMSGGTQALLLQAMISFGTKLNGGTVESARFKDGDAIPTENGVFDCDLSRLMTPTDLQMRPFNLNYDGHDQWCKEQGGTGMSTVEQTLDLLLTALLIHGYHTFMGGWIRCRNAYGSDSSLYVDLYADDGVNVRWANRTVLVHWYGGTLPEKFTKLEL